LFQDYFHKILADKWTRNATMLVMLALIAFQLSIVLWRFVPAPDMVNNLPLNLAAGSGDTPITPQQSHLEKAQLIGRAFLFGKPQVEKLPEVEVEEAPETKLNYKLRGIYYSNIERLSSAIVETKSNNSKSYLLGAELDDKITLSAIARDHILINRYGKLERLNLEKPVVTGVKAKADAGPTGANQLSNTTLLRRYKKRYAKNPLLLARRFQAVAVTENGRSIGYKLVALRGESLLKKLNFEKEDVFVKINGIGLDKPFQALDALKSLTTASSVSVTVRRNGNEETINFSM